MLPSVWKSTLAHQDPRVTASVAYTCVKTYQSVVLLCREFLRYSSEGYYFTREIINLMSEGMSYLIVSAPIDPCNPSQCYNGGTCIPNGVTYTCRCYTGYYGRNCGYSKNIFYAISLVIYSGRLRTV